MIGHTPNEVWYLRRERGYHQYNAQADYALKALGPGPGKCLVIGSPIFEAVELAKAGWEVTYSDIRKPPVELPIFIQGDASKIDFGTEVFDSASMTCVLCHAGMGRYGELESLNADVRIIANIHRALKPEARLVVMFGPVFRANGTAGITHRIYSIPKAVDLMKEFYLLQLNIYNIFAGQWTDKLNDWGLGDCDYLSMVLEKP